MIIKGKQIYNRLAGEVKEEFSGGMSESLKTNLLWELSINA